MTNNDTLKQIADLVCNKPESENEKSDFSVIRTYSSGVHFGRVKEHDRHTRHVTLDQSRRIWSWEGAFTLSAVAQDGITGGKMSKSIDDHLVAEVIEIIPCSAKAEANLTAWPVHEG